MKEFEKPASLRCTHQRHTGCAIYARRPASCQMWSCQWLLNNDTGDMSRPNRVHYVIDIMPDFVTLVDKETGKETNIEVVQVWVDVRFPDAHKDPGLRAYLERRGREGKAAIIRYSERHAFTLFPPTLSSDGEWHEFHGGTVRPERTPQERFAGIAKARTITGGGAHADSTAISSEPSGHGDQAAAGDRGLESVRAPGDEQ